MSVALILADISQTQKVIIQLPTNRLARAGKFEIAKYHRAIPVAILANTNSMESPCGSIEDVKPNSILKVGQRINSSPANMHKREMSLSLNISDRRPLTLRSEERLLLNLSMFILVLNEVDMFTQLKCSLHHF